MIRKFTVLQVISNGTVVFSVLFRLPKIIFLLQIGNPANSIRDAGKSRKASNSQPKNFAAQMVLCLMF